MTNVFKLLTFFIKNYNFLYLIVKIRIFGIFFSRLNILCSRTFLQNNPKEVSPQLLMFFIENLKLFSCQKKKYIFTRNFKYFVSKNSIFLSKNAQKLIFFVNFINLVRTSRSQIADLGSYINYVSMG